MSTTAPAGRFFPVARVPGWLDPETADALLAYAIDSERHYRQAPVLYDGDLRVDDNLRRAAVLPDPGPYGEVLAAAALATKPAVEKALGVPAFTASRVEIELAAHGHGAHFQRHIDTFVAGHRQADPRVLTLVLYLHRRPRAFTGGAIRLHALAGAAVRDIAPDHNLLVAFPAFAPHSVEAISCPGGAFADRRFAVNMWIRA